MSNSGTVPERILRPPLAFTRARTTLADAAGDEVGGTTASPNCRRRHNGTNRFSRTSLIHGAIICQANQRKPAYSTTPRSGPKARLWRILLHASRSHCAHEA